MAEFSKQAIQLTLEGINPWHSDDLSSRARESLALPEENLLSGSTCYAK